MRFCKFIKHLFETTKTDKEVYMAFGRFNPISIAHVTLFKQLSELSKKNDGVVFVFTSQSHDNKKNPLSYNSKIHYLNLSVPNNVNVVENRKIRTIFDSFEYLQNLGYTNINIVVGSDRMVEFERMKKYKDDYNFNDIVVISSGNREIGSEGLSSVSGTKMRKLVYDNDLEGFIKISGLYNNRKEAINMFNNVKKGK